MIQRWSWRELAGTLALATCAVAAASAFEQVPRPSDLPVTRLEGPGGPVSRPAPQVDRQQQLPGLPVTRLDDRARAADLDGPRRISIAVAEPLPLRDMLLLLVRGTPLSLVTDEQVGGTFAGELKDLTMRQALEAVLFPRDLDYDVQGTLIRVFPRKPATRLFDINYLNVRRTASNTSSTTTAALFDELAAGVERLLSPTGRAHVDRTAGLVQVTDFSERLDEVGLYVEAVQLRATRQVRIETRVFEVTFNDAAARSINWTDVAARSAAERPRTAGTAGVRIADFDAVMKGFAALGTVRTIATPQMFATNNEPAILRVGIESVQFLPAADGAVTAARTMEGLSLLVTAQIAADGIVQLHVAPAYSEKSGEARGPRGVSAPVLDVREADTLVRVADGETVIVSGFLRDRQKTTQGTGLAGFFGAQTHETVRSELVILLTPTVVVPGAGGLK